MQTRFSSVVLTGASSGIGEALAREFAAPGVTLLLIARDEARLEAVAAACRAKGATVETARIDVRDADAMRQTLESFDTRVPVDLVIANAGVSAGLTPGHGPEAPGVSRRLMEINYAGMLHTVEPLLPRLIARRAGRIALVSSLAGLRALPDMPSYSATKAAVRGYGIALRGWLARHHVGVTLIYPGFVTSPMSARHAGARPFEIPAEKAATLIHHRLKSGRRVIAFPFPLAAGIFLGNLLPPWLSDLTMRPFEAEVRPDDGR